MELNDVVDFESSKRQAKAPQGGVMARIGRGPLGKALVPLAAVTVMAGAPWFVRAQDKGVQAGPEIKVMEVGKDPWLEKDVTYEEAKELLKRYEELEKGLRRWAYNEKHKREVTAYIEKVMKRALSEHAGDSQMRNEIKGEWELALAQMDVHYGKTEEPYALSFLPKDSRYKTIFVGPWGEFLEFPNHREIGEAELQDPEWRRELATFRGYIDVDCYYWQELSPERAARARKINEYIADVQIFSASRRLGIPEGVLREAAEEIKGIRRSLGPDNRNPDLTPKWVGCDRQLESDPSDLLKVIHL